MNRNFTLILSAALVFILLGVWIYLMFFADANNSEPGPITESGEFTNFDGLEGDEAPTGEGQSGVGSTQSGNGGGGVINLDDNYDPAILRQLTTRSVAGYGELELASSTHILYIESGVGHIYGINLETGVEERISATTIPNTRAAVFSPTGPLVAVRAGPGAGRNTLLLATLDVETQSVVTQEVAKEVDQFAFMSDGTLVFSTVSNSAVVVQSYDTETEETERLFNTPFREARLWFGEAVGGPHYFYPKTSHLLGGFVYVYQNGSIHRLAPDGFGLSAVGGNEFVLITNRNTGVAETRLVELETGEVFTSDTVVIPEKCVAHTEGFYCGVPSVNTVQYNGVDEWNKGRVSYADSLWSINTEGGEELISITGFTGRNVDVTNGSLGRLSNDWYFKAKADNSLWVYELTRATEEAASSTEVTEDSI